MSQALRRPAARFVIRDPLEGQSGRVTGKTAGAAMNADKAYGGGAAGSFDTSRFVTYWLDLLQINPAHEQPKLIYYSGAQPFTRWGVRRIVRTFMSASPRFGGRWAYVGYVNKQYTERSRMAGMKSRQGTTYAYPRFAVRPRTIQLGSGGPD